MIQLIFGSVGGNFLRKTPCPVLVTFLCRGWLSCGNLFGAVEEMSNTWKCAQWSTSKWETVCQNTGCHNPEHDSVNEKEVLCENCAPLGYYAASSGNFVPTFRDNLSVPSSGVKR